MQLTVYVVRNASGAYYRTGRVNWMANPAEARLYTKLGQARAAATRMNAPAIVELTLGASKVIDERERQAAVLARRTAAAKRSDERYKAYLAERAILDRKHNVR